MSRAKTRHPCLNRLYHRYLTDENSAAFIKAVSGRYTLATLQRLAHRGGRSTRRAAVLSLGFLAGYESNAVLGRALHDRDRGVRMLAENAIRDVWFRAGSESQRQQLAILARLNGSRQFDTAAELAGELIDEAPWLAEAWNQRAIAYFHLARYEDSANDCQQTLEMNPYHFGAAVGMAHCYLEMNDAFAALDNFRRALRLNPSLETVRAQVDYLQRSLEGR
jgi:tetratricopeptide (TPR) repeat protein